MALQIGQDFEQRWLNTPVAARQTYIDDLTRICNLLSEDVQLDEWQAQESEAQTQATEQIKQAYQDLAAQIREDARLKHRKHIELRLAQKRQKQQDFMASLEQQFQKNAQEQQHLLFNTAQQLKQNAQDYIAQKPARPLTAITTDTQSAALSQPAVQQALENVQVRLELEAEELIAHIQQSIQAFNSNLQKAAEEEVELILGDQK